MPAAPTKSSRSTSSPTRWTIANCSSSRAPARARLNKATVVQQFPAVAAMDGKGARVHRVFPTQHLKHLDPFVLLDDFHVSAPGGFPEHPHRGFETVTYMVEGRMRKGHVVLKAVPCPDVPHDVGLRGN